MAAGGRSFDQSQGGRGFPCPRRSLFTLTAALLCPVTFVCRLDLFVLSWIQTGLYFYGHDLDLAVATGLIYTPHCTSRAALEMGGQKRPPSVGTTEDANNNDMTAFARSKWNGFCEVESEPVGSSLQRL